MSRKLLLRAAFLVLLVGGLVLWTRQRRPRDLALQIDLSPALPGEISELDVIVRRGDHVLTRKDVNYGKAGAPGLYETLVHAAPGDAEVEATLIYPGKPARVVRQRVALSEDAPARVTPAQ